MKNTMTTSFIMIACMLVTTALLAQKTEKEKFKVYGKCEMCEDRIEEAAKSIDGVKSAEWDKLSKKIKVKFDPEKVKLIEIHEAIVEVGHDTDKMKADDDTYMNLHHCCHYERADGTKPEEHHDH